MVGMTIAILYVATGIFLLLHMQRKGSAAMAARRGPPNYGTLDLEIVGLRVS
jgi:formate hydrogenlyase subunit 4